jgi:hypothetical protein
VFTPAILTIPILVAPLLAPAAPRDCQLGPSGDPAADAQAVVAFEARVREYIAVPYRIAGAVFTPDVAQVFRSRIAASLREYEPGEGAWSVADVLPMLPVDLEYHVTGRDLELRHVESKFVVDVLDLALPFRADLPGDTPPPYEEDEGDAPPSLYEPSGCIYDPDTMTP